MSRVYETLGYGGRQWELHAASDCAQCRFQARLRNRAEARRWLQQFKGNTLSMTELRRLLARENTSLRLDRASDDAILDQAAVMFETGRWLVSAPGHSHASDTQSTGSEGKQGGQSDESQAGAGTSARGQSGTRLTGGSQTGGGGAGKQGAAAGTSKELTWVEIQLLDTGGKPVTGVAFEIKLADGTLKSGKTDELGGARFEQIVPGQCEVKFPELDGGDWKPA